jgi:hypothetical protein
MDRLLQATRTINPLYFMLPVASEDAHYRERVYCYELYHQLRAVWPTDYGYSLCGEVDKSGHPLIRGNVLDKTKPDMIVHVPREMDNNLVVVEIKPINCNYQGVKKDIETLTAYRKQAHYQNAIFLIYGSDENRLTKIIETCKRYQNADNQKIDLSLIRLFHHKQNDCSAQEIEWHS